MYILMYTLMYILILPKSTHTTIYFGNTLHPDGPTGLNYAAAAAAAVAFLTLNHAAAAAAAAVAFLTFPQAWHHDQVDAEYWYELWPFDQT
jgi:hypothetical protein